MTTKAAGILFLTPANEALFLKRGAGGDHPGEWCWPGGTTEGGETAEETAIRETKEELGFLPEGERTIWTRRVAANDMPQPVDAVPPIADPVDFTTFIQRVSATFEPKLSGEHTGFAWANVDTPPEPLHPGARIALARLTMNELDVARAIAAGELTSPQKYMNVWLFAIRITGTGLSYRSSVKEYVWRDRSLYMTDDFLARCNGLAVIIEHPKGALNTKEYHDRSVGSIMLPYLKMDEVWGIAKIHDANAAKIMEDEQLSTSPMVVLGRGDDNTKVILENGEPLLIEGKPALLDHVALVPLGVWDKSGPPTGIQNDLLPPPTEQEPVGMTEEEKAAADKARGDAEASTIDKLLSHLDAAIGKHMKPFGDRLDAMEMADKARKDAEEKREHEDAQHRRDAERADWHKADAASCERDDAEEAKEREEMEGKGEAKEVAADKARRARKDRMKARADAAETEAEKTAAADKAKRDAEEAARKDAEGKAEKERADAILASNTSLAERLANMPKPASDADYPAMADAQARADAVYGAFGQRAPGPLQGETVPAYSRRLARGMQAHSKTWRGVDLHALPDTALAVAEGQIYADAQAAANSSDSLPDDALVQRSYTNQDTGHRITEWRGRHTFIRGLKRPSMRATAFLTGKGN